MLKVLTSLRSVSHHYLPKFFLHLSTIFRYTSINNGQCASEVRSVEIRLLGRHKRTDGKLMNFTLSTVQTDYNVATASKCLNTDL